MEPVVVDVWVQAVGAPLEFALRPRGRPAEPPVLWMSRSDPVRRLALANIAHCDLRVRTLLLKDHECARDALPLRVYLRFYDVQREEIPLPDREGYIMTFEKDSSCQDLSEDYIATGIELIISDDYGLQVDTIFEVEPREFDIPSGGRASPTVRVCASPAYSDTRTSATLLLLSQPLQRCGEGWYRPDPPPQVARLHLEGRGRLQLSRDCLRAQLSALRLPPGGVTRVRKYLQALNVGEAALALRAVTESPWSVIVRQETEDACTVGCGEGSQCLLLDLPPRTSVQLCCELALQTAAVWPEEGDVEGESVEDDAKVGAGPGPGTEEQYAGSVRADTEVKFYDADEVLLARVSLCAAVEVPALRALPSHYDFGFVAHDDCRKTYFTVSHTSTVCALEAVVQCEGAQFEAWPARLSVAPHGNARVYVQYAARQGAVGSGLGPGAEALGAVCVRAVGAAGRWCCTRVTLRAACTRDRARALPVHDHTDDGHLLPA
ncbi:PREDICTED: uncharacterized protein LOC106126967 [Papilio xuthus]|uniref:Uncharacterized protein LOC106126967 n=1 Tax=Papilio xuthus TaxID=66420 RepID=A0AAJ6ZWD0_PAPXU|nr:PREDICTED: uncharacterized protein LOC106126967 [Papilio xuthus]